MGKFGITINKHINHMAQSFLLVSASFHRELAVSGNTGKNYISIFFFKFS